MKCIRIFGHTQEDGTFKVASLVHEHSGTTENLDDWNTVTQVLRLRKQNETVLLFVDEGALIVEEGYLMAIRG